MHRAQRILGQIANIVQLLFSMQNQAIKKQDPATAFCAGLRILCIIRMAQSAVHGKYLLNNDSDGS